MKTIIITSTNTVWKEAQKKGYYDQSTLDETLEAVGFIHATKPDQVTALLNRRMADRDDILLLLVDLDKLKSEVKFEKTKSGTPGLFPHIYGPVNIDAVYDCITPEKKDGQFVKSEVLASLDNKL